MGKRKNRRNQEHVGHRRSNKYDPNAKGIAKMCRNKTTYDTYDDAIAGAISASRLIGACRIYECPHCKHYHLTTNVEVFDFDSCGV